MVSWFLRHFGAHVPIDPSAILGYAPIICYCSRTNPRGFALTLSMARNHLTHCRSLTETFNIFSAFTFVIQANKVSSKVGSRIISHNSFMVNVKSKNEIIVRGQTKCR